MATPICQDGHTPFINVCRHRGQRLNFGEIQGRLLAFSVFMQWPMPCRHERRTVISSTLEGLMKLSVCEGCSSRLVDVTGAVVETEMHAASYSYTVISVNAASSTVLSQLTEEAGLCILRT
eukprot:4210356-Pleurochrysis_carterae.AAC.2